MRFQPIEEIFAPARSISLVSLPTSPWDLCIWIRMNAIARPCGVASRVNRRRSKSSCTDIKVPCSTSPCVCWADATKRPTPRRTRSSRRTGIWALSMRRNGFSWIYRILRNECLNVIRGQRTWEPLSDDVVGAVATSDALEDIERQRAVQRAVMSLSHEYREVIALRHFAGLSYEDIAVTLGIPAKTVKSRLYSARQRLAASLSAWKVQS